MDPRFASLCVTLLLSASFTRRSGAVGPVVRCEPCDVVARLLCKPLPRDCAERVREPGCGCCPSCALSFGQPCGVYSGRCGVALTCQHQPGETKPLQALLEGRGICANATHRSRVSAGPTTHRPTGPLRPPLHPFFPSAKSEVLRREQQKRTQSFKMEALPGPLITDQQNFSLGTKQEPEYGPCRREIESILSSLKITDILNPRGFRIPNCDKKGFYKRKQCRPSKGRKRGFCWCVDKYGQPLPGFSEKERGDGQYYNSESQ
uniref:Insulin-like growth factor-binding protein 3 n=1 Tax=Cyclopterus lumpus TaxID=8103 RepID=A0A8C2WGS2_CYCLU